MKKNYRPIVTPADHFSDGTEVVLTAIYDPKTGVLQTYDTTVPTVAVLSVENLIEDLPPKIIQINRDHTNN